MGCDMRTAMPLRDVCPGAQVMGADERGQAALDAAVELMHFREIPSAVKRRVKSHFAGCWRTSPAVYCEQASHFRNAEYHHISCRGSSCS